MHNYKQPISDNDLILLQAYIEQVVSIENKCRNNLSYTEWYLQDKFSSVEVKAVIEYLKEKDIKSDCDLIMKSMTDTSDKK